MIKQPACLLIYAPWPKNFAQNVNMGKTRKHDKNKNYIKHVLKSKKNKCMITAFCIDIFRISELKWTRMGEFNSGDHYVYYCGQESLRRNGVALIANKRV